MPRLTRDKKDAIKKALAEEKSPTEIAKELGIARSSVYRLMGGTASKTKAQQEDTQSDNGSEGSGSAASVEQEEEQDADNEDENNPVRRFYKMSDMFAADLGLKESKEDYGDDDNKPQAVKVQQEQDNNDAKANFMRMMNEATEPVQRVEIPTTAALAAQLRRPMPQEIPDPDFDRGQVIQQIMFNVEHFAPIIRRIIGEDAEAFVQSLPTRSDKELAGLLAIIDRTRSVGNLSTTFKHTFYMAANGAEIVTSQFLGMKTSGFVRALQAQDTEIQMAIKELAIENYNKFNKMNRPEMRLGMLAVMTLIQVDSTARLREAMGGVATPAVPAATEERYADL